MTKIFTASKSMTSGLSNAVSTVSVALFIAEKNWYKVQKVLELPPLASVFIYTLQSKVKNREKCDIGLFFVPFSLHNEFVLILRGNQHPSKKVLR